MSKTVELYEKIKKEKEKYKPLWKEISKYCGVQVDPSDNYQTGSALDIYALDPTASLSVTQSSEYIKGVLIGTGTNLFSILPSDEILRSVDKSTLDKWYEYATIKALEEINHPESGFHSALSGYMYDECAFGTAGIGCFKNSSLEDNKLIFRNYGIDTLLIDVGKNGTVETIMNEYKWRTNEFVEEFCLVDGVIDPLIYKTLPQEVKTRYENGDVNEEFKVVFAITRNNIYDSSTTDGKKSFKYKGEWFMTDTKEIFLTEYFKHKPVSVGRPVVIRGEIYGRAYGTMLISSIRCIDEMINGAMVTLDKLREPALGSFGGLTGDNVIDTSAGSLNVFDAETLQGQQPIFPLQDVGDPTGIIQLLLPYLQEKVATAFKIDSLLDFASNKDMTATESLQRASIRNKSLVGLVINQVNEVLLPLCDRAVNLLMSANALGATEEEEIAALMGIGRGEVVIPSIVNEFINSGKKWYKIKFNTEIEKIGNTEKIDNLLQMLNFATSIMSVYPQLSSGIDWYKMWLDVSEAYNGTSYSMDAKKFKKQIEEQAQAQSQAMALEAANMQSQTTKNNASAMRDLGNGN